MTATMTANRKPRVISYLRFSRAEQLDGDSQRRQLELSRSWADRNGVKVDENLADLGVSAFRGKNAATGALSAFLELVKRGKIAKGSVLLVESLDRLSRSELIDALELFLSVIRNGVKIVTLADGFEYDRDNCNLQNLMYSLMVMSRAHEESATKSKRLAAAWKAKRANISAKPLTGLLPAWLKMDGGKIVVDKPKAAMVKLIFKLAASGHGLNAITKKLNADDKAKAIGRVGYFNRSYVFKLLKSRAVLGEFQPHTVSYVDGKRRRDPIGEPIKGYFPSIVPAQDSYAANAAMRSKRKTGGATSKFINLFSGLLHCVDDGSPIRIQDKGCGRRYVSSAAIEGRKGAAKFVAFPIRPFETAMILRLGDKSLFVGKGDDRAEQLDTAIGGAEGELSEVEAKIEKIQETLITGAGAKSGSVVGLLNKLDARKVALSSHLAELREQRASLSGDGSIAELVALIESASKGELSREQREQLRNVMRRMVSRIDCHFIREGLDYVCGSMITLRNGKEFDFTFRASRLDTMRRNAKGHPIATPNKTTEPTYDLTLLAA